MNLNTSEEYVNNNEVRTCTHMTETLFKKRIKKNKMSTHLYTHE